MNEEERKHQLLLQTIKDYINQWESLDKEALIMDLLEDHDNDQLIHFMGRQRMPLPNPPKKV